MTQSDRIRLYNQYYANPLREEYEKEVEKIRKHKPPVYILLCAFWVVPLILFFVYGFIFATHENLDVQFVIFILGVLNVVGGLFYTSYLFWNLSEKYTDQYNKAALRELKDKYREKGLVVITEADLYNAPCCERDYLDRTVCCVTKEPLQNNAYFFCSDPGKCKDCKTFISALYGADVAEDMEKNGHQFKM